VSEKGLAEYVVDVDNVNVDQFNSRLDKLW